MNTHRRAKPELETIGVLEVRRRLRALPLYGFCFSVNTITFTSVGGVAVNVSRSGSALESRRLGSRA